MMMVFNDGKLGRQRILRAKTLAEMLSPQNQRRAVGFRCPLGPGLWLLPILDYAGKNAWHQGGEGMWNSVMLILPEHKLGVVGCLSNRRRAGG